MNFHSEDPVFMDTPRIFDTEMDGSAQETGQFFTSAYSSPGQLFGLNSQVNSPFQSSMSLKTPNMQIGSKSNQNPPELSTSPESSADSSSDGSSRRKRKSSSRSSHSGTDVNMADSGQPVSGSTPCIKREHAFDSNLSNTQSFDNYEFGNGEMYFDFSSAANSPDTQPSQSSPPNAAPLGYRIPYQDSPRSSQNLFPRSSASASVTRETSPLSTMISANHSQMPTQSHTSPASSHEDNIDYSSFNAINQHVQWSPYQHMQVHPRQLTMGNHQHHALPPHIARYPPLPFKCLLTIHPTPQKSRVETQIPIKMTLFPVPKGVTNLHLPTYTISKPKLLARPSPPKSADTLELHTMLVCTSAMQDPDKYRRALARAADIVLPRQDSGRRSSSGDSNADDENKPLNGGEVHICAGCITRERKRAARKKSKKPEEEEPWQRDEAKRIIVFNCPEVREWQKPAAPNAESNSQPENGTGPQPPSMDLPEGAMQMEVPMRIACYCRHQNEKLGFQVILTIKDHEDNLIAQAITNSIVITDDHKTHAPPTQMPQNGMFSEQPHMPMFAGEAGNYPLHRNAMSTPDFQVMQQHYPPQFPAQQMNPFATPHSVSQATSTTMTPRNLSRQASPSTGGPAPKKRKPSGGGSGKLPDHLTMTRLQTAPTTTNFQNQPWSAPGQSYPISPPQVSPFAPNFPSINSPQDRPAPHHAAQSSPQFYNGPPTPGTDQPMFNQNNRAQSMENIPAAQQMFSAPSSARASRAASPIVDLQSHAHGLPYATISPSTTLNPSHPPIINKLIPSEGPKSGGIEVTCLGSGFVQGLEVMFGDTVATTTTYWGERSLVCLLPPAIRPGLVAVTLRHEYEQRLQMARNYPQPLPKNQVYFRYVDDDEQELLRQALRLLSQKQSGHLEDAGDIARRIIQSSGGGPSAWSGGHGQGGQHRYVTSAQSVLANSMDTEATVLRCLEMVDLDDSPYRAELNLIRTNGQSMLHMAASLGYDSLVAGLLARGANVDLRDHNGMSPMHMAAVNGHARIVKRLRFAGGDPTMRSLLGYTPADMASSTAVLSAVNYSPHIRSRSAGPTPHSFMSRASSTTSLVSYMPTSTTASFRLEDSSEEDDSEDDDSESEEAITMSTPRTGPSLVPPTIEVEGNPSPMFFAAWGDHLATQLQQFHQSVNRSLPNSLIPNLPNFEAYQAHPMVRRFSSLVPQRNHSPPGASSGTDSKENDSKWWEFLRTGSTSPPPAISPPAYDEIYPTSSRVNLDLKTTSAATAAVEAVADDKCTALFESGQTSSSSSLVLARSTTQPSTPKARTVKSLRSDKKLFFIWIPIFITIILVTCYSRVPQVIEIIQRFTNERQQERIVEVL